MTSLLVADDTPIIRSTIARVVARANLGFDTIVEAGNGAEAVELARQARPDVILIDIKMPGLDGLQAASIIRAELPAIKIIILTAYDEFPYVQKALKLGVFDYLLKPIRPAKLADILAQVCAQLRQEQEQRQAIASTETYLEGAIPMLESSLVEQLVRGADADRAAAESAIRRLGRAIAWPAVLVADVEDSELGASAPLEKLIPMVPGQDRTFLVGFCAPRRLIAIVSTDPAWPTADHLRNLGAGIYHALSVKLGLAVAIGAGRPVADLASLPLSYAQALLACRHAASQPGQRVSHIDDLKGAQPSDKPAYPAQLERELLESVRRGEAHAAGALLNDLLDYLVFQCRERPDAIRHLLSEVLALVARAVIAAGAPEAKVLDLSHAQVAELSSVKATAAMRAWAQSSLAECLAAIPERVPANEDVIQRALDYIYQNQHRPDLMLEEVAAAAGLSASHLAHLLKERAGVSYKQYLTAQRIEAAKRLLRTTNLTIAAIGEAVGYQNATNFYRLFQRETGRTPAAYRKGAACCAPTSPA